MNKIWLCFAFVISIESKEQEINQHLERHEKLLCRKWINAIPVQNMGSIVDSLVADLNTIGKAIGNAQIVGIGESTHGTKEFYLQKIRLFKYLVLHKGFTELLLEDGYGAVDQINKYINDSSIEKPFNISKSKIYDFFKTEEIKELFEWMKTYNKSHHSKLTCLGLDVQSVEPELSNIVRFGKSQSRSIDKRMAFVKKGFQKLILLKYNNPLLRDSLINELKICTRVIQQNTFTFSNLYDSAYINSIIASCKSLMQYLVEDEYRWNNMSARDYYMNINLEFHMMQKPQAKVFIWAHNGHIADIEGTEIDFQIGGSLGHYLKRKYCQQYYSIGLLTSKGSYAAASAQNKRNFKIYELPEPKNGSLEKIFLDAQTENTFVNLRDLAAINCFNKNLSYRAAPFYYFKNHYGQVGNPLRLYDGMMYISTTHATTIISKN